MVLEEGTLDVPVTVPFPPPPSPLLPSPSTIQSQRGIAAVLMASGSHAELSLSHLDKQRAPATSAPKRKPEEDMEKAQPKKMRPAPVSPSEPKTITPKDRVDQFAEQGLQWSVLLFLRPSPPCKGLYSVIHAESRLL